MGGRVLGKRDGRVPEEEVVENQKDRVRAARLPILSSTFLEKTLERETLKITCFINTFRPRQVCRYDRISVVRELPAGRWGVLTTREEVMQTAP